MMSEIALPEVCTETGGRLGKPVWTVGVVCGWCWECVALSVGHSDHLCPVTDWLITRREVCAGDVCSRDVPHRCYKVLQTTERSFKMGENYRESCKMGEGMGGDWGRSRGGRLLWVVMETRGPWISDDVSVKGLVSISHVYNAFQVHLEKKQILPCKNAFLVLNKIVKCCHCFTQIGAQPMDCCFYISPSVCDFPS